MATRRNLTDADIVARVTEGDVDAFAALIERYENKLVSYVTYLLHDPTTALDVVQDTFLKVYKNLHSFNPKYKFSSWIYRIAHNEAMNAVKKQRRISDTDIDELPETSYDQPLDELIDKEMLGEHVHGCMKKLDPKYREVIQLVYFEHMKYEEVSDILHVPTSTVGVWLSRAKAKLKVICEQRGVQK